MANEDKIINELPISIYDRMISKLPFFGQIFWVIFSVFLFLIFLLLAILTSGSMSYIIMPISASFMIAFLPIVYTSISKKLSAFGDVLLNIVNQPESEIRHWYQSHLKKIFFPARMCVFGVIFAVLFVCSTGTASNWWRYPVSWFDSNACSIYLSFMTAVAGFMGGTGIHILFYTALMVYRLPELKLKIIVFQHPVHSIKAIGRMYMNIALMVAIAEMAFIITFISSPLKLTLFIALWLTAIGFIAVIYFFAPLLRIHKKMSNMKHELMNQFSLSLEETFRAVIKGADSENTKRLRELMEIRTHLNKMSEWPFDTDIVIKLVSAVIIPIVVLLIQAKDILKSIF